MPRVFGIGFSRTGTFSLHVALQIMGYKSVHFPRTLHDIDSHDAAVDTSVTCGYQFLDVMYPDSKFILTVREPTAWLDSMLRSWGDALLETQTVEGRVRRALFGDAPFTQGHGSDLLAALERHLSVVRDYFRHRPNDLLELNICAGEGWGKLCPFLGYPAPKVGFPNVKCV